jgi:hypothetical protein
MPPPSFRSLCRRHISDASSSRPRRNFCSTLVNGQSQPPRCGSCGHSPGITQFVWPNFWSPALRPALQLGCGWNQWLFGRFWVGEGVPWLKAVDFGDELVDLVVLGLHLALQL